jgi:hypothetical protein
LYEFLIYPMSGTCPAHRQVVVIQTEDGCLLEYYTVQSGR